MKHKVNASSVPKKKHIEYRLKFLLHCLKSTNKKPHVNAVKEGI